MRSALAITLLALFLAASGCAESEVIVSLEGEILAGTADPDGTGFVEVPDGTDAELRPGSQGGFHVWLNVSIRGLEGRLTIEREARRLSDDALVYRGQRQTLEIPEDAMLEWWDNPTAAPAFMCPSPIGIQVYDQELLFTVRLLDENDGILAEDQISLTPRCPEGDQEAFCHRICAG